MTAKRPRDSLSLFGELSRVATDRPGGCWTARSRDHSVDAGVRYRPLAQTDSPLAGNAHVAGGHDDFLRGSAARRLSVVSPKASVEEVPLRPSRLQEVFLQVRQPSTTGVPRGFAAVRPGRLPGRLPDRPGARGRGDERLDVGGDLYARRRLVQLSVHYEGWVQRAI